MKWIKKGLIFKVENNHDWMQTHAQVPIADTIDENRLRIYFGTRDKYSRTLTTYIDVEADNPQNIIYIHDKPILPLGKLGRFDDCGVMPSWIVNRTSRKYFYYTGWNRGRDEQEPFAARYRIATGLAISDDNGQTFRKISEGPIMDRTLIDPISVAAQCVLIENEVWKMWYISFTDWIVAANSTEPVYHVKYAESLDGIYWNAKGVVCLDDRSATEAIARPCVWKQDGKYRMMYCYRKVTGYRNDKTQSYRIGYAESTDGLTWVRKDDEAGIEISETGWDSEMIAYPYVYEHRGRKYMLYNGNGFGKSGFGYTVLEE